MAMIAITMCIYGCSSSNNSYQSDSNAVEKKDANGCVLGTGAGNRCPQPQTHPADIAGIKGATITNEPYSRNGNKDYMVLGKNYKVWRNLDSYYEEGMASWYGPGFHGQNTSNGEHYNMHGFTAAHKNLPLPSFLKVTNIANGKSVIVRVNDRGPFHGSRILDLSRGAASQIGIIGPGTGKVKIELIKPTNVKNQTSVAVMNGFKPYIQVFVTESLDRARDITSTVKRNTGKPTTIENSSGNYRIKVGPLTENEAGNILAKIKDLGYKNAYFTAK